MGEKYRKKVEHLKMKYEVDRNKEVDMVPQEMEKWRSTQTWQCLVRRDLKN